MARSYRAPTLNERYWVPGGNPALLPEAGWGSEAGLRHQMLRCAERLSFHVLAGLVAVVGTHVRQE